MRRGYGPRRWAPLAAVVLFLASCGRGSVSGPTASFSSPGAETAPPSTTSPTTAVPALNDLCPQAPDVPGLEFAATDGKRLYGAVLGTGQVGIVMANDVPHPLCEEVAESVYLAHRGFRVLVFDYRAHGELEAESDRGRLDLDVEGAVAELRRLGAGGVFLMGFYAGGAVALVAATDVQPPVSGVVAASAAAKRGQYVNGPYTAPGALDVAPRLRVPVLMLAVRTDRFVPLAEDRGLYGLIGSSDKRLVVFPYGGGGLDLFDLSPFTDRANRAILQFLRTDGG